MSEAENGRAQGVRRRSCFSMCVKGRRDILRLSVQTIAETQSLLRFTESILVHRAKRNMRSEISWISVARCCEAKPERSADASQLMFKGADDENLIILLRTMHHTNAKQTSMVPMGGGDARTAASPHELRALRPRLRNR